MSKFKPIEMLCEWETYEDESGQENADVWYGKVEWFDDNHFYGYAADGEVADHDLLPITHFILGVYKEGLGVTVIKISQNPNYAPMLFRGAPDSEGKFSGDFYAVLPTKFVLGNPITGDTKSFDKVSFQMVGRAHFSIENARMSLSDLDAIEHLKHIAIYGLQDEFYSGITSRFENAECIEEMLADLEKNVYPYETGEEYEEKKERSSN